MDNEFLVLLAIGLITISLIIGLQLFNTNQSNEERTCLQRMTPPYKQCLCWSNEACSTQALKWINEGLIAWDEDANSYYWHTWTEDVNLED